MSDNENNKIVPIDKKPLPFKVKPVGLAARKASAMARGEAAPIDNVEGSPESAKHRIGIVFDDSGSMYGNKITDAHEGCEEFIRNCNPLETAIAVYPMNAAADRSIQQFSLTRKLYAVATGIKLYRPTGGTPLYETLELILRAEPLTRGIVFSDGEPNPRDTDSFKESSIATAIEKKIPVDTVYIGSREDTKAVTIMQEIAERTGGIFLIFEPGKANFKTAFKYLTPGYRAMLADKSFVAKIERGEVK
jgi:Mg-chelatase subunit ChlD